VTSVPSANRYRAGMPGMAAKNQVSPDRQIGWAVAQRSVRPPSESPNGKRKARSPATVMGGKHTVPVSSTTSDTGQSAACRW